MSVFTVARRRAAAVAGVAALAVGALVTGPAAHAADVTDQVVDTTSIHVTNAGGDTELEQWQMAGVDFAFDSHGKPVRSGDTFGVTFPAGFEVLAGTFEVKDQSDPTRALATCATTPSADQVTASVRCAFTDHAATRTSVRGTVRSQVQLSKATTADSVVFLVGATPVTVGLPGTGGIVPDESPVADHTWKQGWFNPDQKSIHWEIVVPGSDVPAGSDLVISDVFPKGLEAATNHWVASTPNVPNWKQLDAFRAEPYTLTRNDATGLEIRVDRSHIEPGRVYRISYDTVATAPAAAPGEKEREYTNSATIAGRTVSGKATRSTTGSGDGAGDAHTPKVEIVKGDTAGRTGDDAAAPVALDAASTGLRFTVRNTGTDALEDVTVTDATTKGGTITGLTCTFPDGTTGTTWPGPLAVGGTFDCTATLTGMTPGTVHADVATVTGTGVLSGTKVTDDDPYHATREAKPAAGSLDGAIGSLDAGSLGAPLGAGSLAGLGGPGSLALGSAGLGSAALIGVCVIPLPGVMLPFPLPQFCPAARTPAPAPHDGPQAPGPGVPNGRG